MSPVRDPFLGRVRNITRDRLCLQEQRSCAPWDERGVNHQTKNKVGMIGLNSYVPLFVVDVVDEVTFSSQTGDP